MDPATREDGIDRDPLNFERCREVMDEFKVRVIYGEMFNEEIVTGQFCEWIHVVERFKEDTDTWQALLSPATGTADACVKASDKADTKDSSAEQTSENAELHADGKMLDPSSISDEKKPEAGVDVPDLQRLSPDSVFDSEPQEVTEIKGHVTDTGDSAPAITPEAASG